MNMESWELQLALGSTPLISAKSSVFFLRTKIVKYHTVSGVIAEDPTVKHKGTRNELLDFKYIFLLKNFLLIQKELQYMQQKQHISNKISFHKG